MSQAEAVVEQEESKEEADARVAVRLAEMRAAQEAARREAAEAAEAALRASLTKPRRISLNEVGFRELTDLLAERGVPLHELAACTNKAALRAAAARCKGEALDAIEWNE